MSAVASFFFSVWDVLMLLSMMNWYDDVNVADIDVLCCVVHVSPYRHNRQNWQQIHIFVFCVCITASSSRLVSSQMLLPWGGSISCSKAGDAMRCVALQCVVIVV